MSDERAAWDRLADESTKAYASFRVYRDLGPTRSLSRMPAEGLRSAHRWSQHHDWGARAAAWDDHQAMIEDAEHLDALRSMHRTHQTAARALQRFALSALAQLPTSGVEAGDIVRLLDLGTRLERLTLSQSVPELLGQQSSVDDPWERIAHELSAP